MRVCDQVECAAFPCRGVLHDAYSVPAVDEDRDAVRVVLISEAAPADPADGYDAAGDPLFARTTVEAFREAGFDVTNIDDVRALGVHLTTAVKCAKVGYQVEPATVRECAALLADELRLFPGAAAILLMGEVAARALNEVACRAGQPRPVPAGPTYKVRREVHSFFGTRVFPSYLQAGPAFYIERQKRRMIAEDIAAAMAIAGEPELGHA
jgi:uracil-DNA glycosylase